MADIKSTKEAFNIEDYLQKPDPLDVRALLIFNLAVSLLLLYSGEFPVLLSSFLVSFVVMSLFKMRVCK